jgi:hypothetical protein
LVSPNPQPSKCKKKGVRERPWSKHPVPLQLEKAMDPPVCSWTMQGHYVKNGGHRAHKTVSLHDPKNESTI